MFDWTETVVGIVVVHDEVDEVVKERRMDAITEGVSCSEEVSDIIEGSIYQVVNMCRRGRHGLSCRVKFSDCKGNNNIVYAMGLGDFFFRYAYVFGCASGIVCGWSRVGGFIFLISCCGGRFLGANNYCEITVKVLRR